MALLHGVGFRQRLASLGILALGVSCLDHAILPDGPVVSESVASRGLAESRRDLEVLIPPVVRVPLGGLAEIDVTLREGLSQDVQISVDPSRPGLVALSGVMRHDETLGAIRVGALGPLAVGDTFTLRITARSGTQVSTAVSDAIVVDRTGSLDPSFAGTGTFVALGSKYEGDGFSNVRVQPDGSVLATGRHYTMAGSYLRAAWVRADGSPGPDGSGSGLFFIRLTETAKNATAFAIGRQSTGRIVLAGVDDPKDCLVLVALLPTGERDGSFGDTGVVELSPAGDATAALALAVAPDDALVVAGRRGGHSLIARLTPDGTPDPRFGEGGYAMLDPVHDAVSEIRGVAVDRGGRVVAVGQAGAHAFVVRLSPDGSVDRSFMRSSYRSSGGHVLPTPEPGDEATVHALALSPDGGILAGGTVRHGGSSSVAVWRLQESGNPDFYFGAHSPVTPVTPGLAAFPAFGAFDPMGGLTLLPDGRIVLAVNLDRRTGEDAEHGKPFLLRLLPDGTPDPAFGPGGFVRVPLGEGDFVQSTQLDRASAF